MITSADDDNSIQNMLLVCLIISLSFVLSERCTHSVYTSNDENWHMVERWNKRAGERGGGNKTAHRKIQSILRAKFTKFSIILYMLNVVVESNDSDCCCCCCCCVVDDNEGLILEPDEMTVFVCSLNSLELLSVWSSQLPKKTLNEFKTKKNVRPYNPRVKKSLYLDFIPQNLHDMVLRAAVTFARVDLN